MAARIETLSTYFPDAKIIVIERDRVIFSSTEALQKLLFNIASDVLFPIAEKAIYKILEDLD